MRTWTSHWNCAEVFRICKRSASYKVFFSAAGLAVNHDRPDSKLPYDGKWLWLGASGIGGGMIHLMVLPNPDPTAGRPEHGGRDRHTCVEVTDVQPLKEALDRGGRSETLALL